MSTLRTHILKSFGIASLTFFIASGPLTAADLNISNQPIEFSGGVQSNLLFLMDDSGSMDLGIIAPNDTNNLFPDEDVSSFVGGGMRVATGDTGCEYFYTHPDPDSNDGAPERNQARRSDNAPNGPIVPTEAFFDSLADDANGNVDNPGAWRAWFSGFNAIYYNPDVVYTPWQGTMDDGTTVFANVSETAAPYNPFKATSQTLDLTTSLDYTTEFDCDNTSSGNINNDNEAANVTDFFPARYYISDDTNDVDDSLTDNGFADPSDNHTLVEIRAPADVTNCTTGASCPNDAFTRTGLRTDCGGNGVASQAVTCTYAQEIQNFANWFSYYRKRDLVAKAAVSNTITPSSARVGLGTLQNNNSVGTFITDIDDISPRFDGNGAIDQAAIDAAAARKDNLLSKLFQISPGGGTPLRQRLEDAGEYYDNVATSLFGGESVRPDPILDEDDGGSCQQNFTLMFTDGFWNGNAPDVGNADGDNNTDHDGGSYADTFDNTLADVAMHYYEGDLSALPNLVPTIDGVDENTAQHMTTFGFAFGVNGTLDSNPPNRTDAFAWPSVSANSPETVDDLRHAAWNGRGSFLSANDPVSLNAALERALNQIAETSGQAAAVGASTTSFNTDTLLFQSFFDSRRWSGDVIIFGFPSGLILEDNLRFGFTPGIQLDRTDPDDRVIITYRTDLGVAVPFQISRNGLNIANDGLSAEQIMDLRTDTDGNPETDDVLANLRIDFIKGDRSCENRDENDVATCGDGSLAGLPFRARGNGDDFGNDRGRLGDIIHSAPDFVGRPLAFFYPDTFPFPEQDATDSNDGSYSDYEFNNQTRAGVFYVGANDGMLHAFASGTPDPQTGILSPQLINGNATTPGKELFGYIPSAVYSPINANGDLDVTKGLHKLTEQDYTHLFYVDNTPSVDPARITLNNVTQWRDILVGTLRAGGQGVFAMDVTNPDTLATESDVIDNVLWEFNDRDPAGNGNTTAGDSDLGFTYSKPIITLVQEGSNPAQESSYTWVAIFGNGYNNMLDDGSASTTGNAVLYIVDLETGDLLDKIDTGVGKDPNDANDTPNGLSGVAGADIDLNGTTDVVYAGDLKGNLWKFDLRGGSNNWDIPYSQGNTKKPVFEAVVSTTGSPVVSQPITTTPFITGGPVGRGGLLISFGTGKLFETTDQSPLGLQTFYTVWDQDPDDPRDFIPFDKDDLLEQTLDVQRTDFGDGTPTETILTNSDNDIAFDDPLNTIIDGHLGWYLDLDAFPVGLNNDQNSERVFVDPIVIGGIVFFNSSIPDSNICAGGGDSVLYTLDRLSGGNPGFPALDFNGDGLFDSDDMVDDPNSDEQINVAGVKKDGIATEPTFVGDRIFQGGVGDGNVGQGVNTGGNDDDDDDCIAGSECERRNIGANTGRLSWRELLR